MQARPGDEVVIEGHRVGTAPRHGEVLDVEGAMLRVAWDDGHESALIPGSDCRVVRDTADEARTSPEEAHVERFGTTIDLRLLEDPRHCDAVVTLITREGTVQGRGRSLCSPDDPNGPLSGEEMAISRALRALSDRLREMALASEAHGEVPTAHLLE